MLQGEHSAILSTFIKLQFVIKIFVLSILSGRFTQVLLYCTFDAAILPSCTTLINISEPYSLPPVIPIPRFLLLRRPNRIHRIVCLSFKDLSISGFRSVELEISSTCFGVRSFPSVSTSVSMSSESVQIPLVTSLAPTVETNSFRRSWLLSLAFTFL